MRVAILTREYPPEIYGGAGVHVEFLVAHMRSLCDLSVHCFGAPRLGAEVTAHQPDPRLAQANPTLGTLSTDLDMVARVVPPDVVHSHTWYANLAGHWASMLHHVPHVLTAHSLEPRRPWKADQLGGGYAISCWAEKTAYDHADAIIAVSQGMRADILATYPFVDEDRIHVVSNGIDTEAFAPDQRQEVHEQYDIDLGRPYVLFVGRITEQKGVHHLLAAMAHLDPAVQLVLSVGSPDTHLLFERIKGAVEHVRESGRCVTWIDDMLPREQLLQLFTHAAVFVCPSVYEPLGLVNLEAMACATPVVASAVGGIPEVVVEGETGYLVAYDPSSSEEFQRGLAERITYLLNSPDLAEQMGLSGRRRVTTHFTWQSRAQQTLLVYEAAIQRS